MTPDDVRRLALALPEVEEAPHFQRTAFRVRGKVLATLGKEAGVNLALPEQVAEALTGGDDPVARSIVWGRIKGWVHLDLSKVDEPLLSDLLAAAWRRVAPRRLAAAHASDGDAAAG